MKLVVIGSANMDLVISLPRIPSVGETVLGGKSSMIFGGKGANQAVASIRSGGDSSFIAKVGNDLFGHKMKEHFAKEGFRSEMILTDREEPTGIAQIFVSEKGENSIAVAPGANMKLLPEDIDQFHELIKNAEVVLLQLETPVKTIEYIADMAYKNGVKLILNPAPAQLLSRELLKKIWMITPNESEASLLTGIEVTDAASAALAALKLHECGVEHIVVTLGASGSLVFNSSGYSHFSAPRVKAIDSTAAGDVFNGCLATAITAGESLESAIKFASAAAAISVTREGAQPSIPTRSEINLFIETNQD